MKQLCFLLTIVLPSILLSQDWTDKTRVLPDKLREVPVSIYIMHDPNPNYPEPTVPEDKSDMKYVWRHKTSVYSPEKALTVVAAGSFIWYSADGWKSNVSYNKKQFAKLFKCPQGKLEPGKTYTFEKNYRWGNNLYGGDALWYVLAKDGEGNLYKGIGLIETESTILNR